MEIKYSTDKQSYKRMTTAELEEHFLIKTLFKEDSVESVYVETDRVIIGSAVPVSQRLQLTANKKEMAADYFAERREIGIINIGNKGKITVDGKEYILEFRDALYIGRGAKEIFFENINTGIPKFYFASYPAHISYPTSIISYNDAAKVTLGSAKDANRRTINKYIHTEGVKSCQLAMGLTELDEGSVWNTMPVHTHQRRSEVYMYFNLPDKAVVFHLMGEPDETRHFVMRNGQAVASPIWSIHSGVGTSNYSFIWAMGGENQVYDDMDWVDMNNLR